MKLSMNGICAICKGKCCHGHIFLGKRDISNLQKAGNAFEIGKDETGFYLKLKDGKCPFLDEKKGCKLLQDLKPIDCHLFPLAITESIGGFKFYLNKLCPFFNKIPKSWIEKNKQWANSHLLEWTAEERKMYIKRQVNLLLKIV